jgi:signal transduction histidine kinase
MAVRDQAGHPGVSPVDDAGAEAKAPPDAPARPRHGLKSPIRHLRGLRVQLLLWTILPLSIALIVLSFAGVFRHRQTMQHMVEDRDRGLVLAEANSVARSIERRAAQLATAAGTLNPTPNLSPGPNDMERLTTLLGPDFGGALALVDTRNQALFIPAGEPGSWARLPQVSELANRALSTHRPQYGLLAPSAATAAGNDAQSLLLAVAAPGDRALLAQLPMEALGLSDAGVHLQTETGGAVYILDDAGQVLYMSNPGAMAIAPAELGHAVQMAQTGNQNMPMPNMTVQGGGGQAGFTYLARKGQRNLLLAYAPIEPVGWKLVTAEDVSQMLGSGLGVAEVLPMVLLFVAVLALLAVSFGMAAIVRPLQELDRRAARVAWGEFDAVDTPVGGIQEIDDLRDTLAQMAVRIRSYQSGMRDYLSATTQAQEDERARLAHELHDDTVQSLIALKQRAQMARKALGSDPERATTRLDELTGLIDQELVGLRRLIGDLRPIYLEDLGFVPALEMLAQRTQERYGLVVDLAIHGEPVRLASDLELAAYRIVQQGLNNVVAHAAAKHARVTATFGSHDLTLSIQDDGRGFTPPDQPADLAREGHFGLMGMRERAMLYGGHLLIASAPGQGTTVTARLVV